MSKPVLLSDEREKKVTEGQAELIAGLKELLATAERGELRSCVTRRSVLETRFFGMFTRRLVEA